jgi:hypothetical protein
VRVVDVEKNRSRSGTAPTNIARILLLTALCIQSFPFALFDVLTVGTTRWGKKIKKNPGNNKNNADRQRFQGGFVKTDPPFDYLAHRPTLSAPTPEQKSPFLFPFLPKHVQFLRKPLKSPSLRIAITEFHA